jgi:hypothetical protein
LMILFCIFLCFFLMNSYFSDPHSRWTLTWETNCCFCFCDSHNKTERDYLTAVGVRERRPPAVHVIKFGEPSYSNRRLTVTFSPCLATVWLFFMLQTPR